MDTAAETGNIAIFQYVRLQHYPPAECQEGIWLADVAYGSDLKRLGCRSQLLSSPRLHIRHRLKPSGEKYQLNL